MATRVSPETLFVTGTDTGVGKTLAASALIRRMRTEGLNARGYKPVASGAEMTPHGLRNEDALALLEAEGVAAGCPQTVYARTNPYCFVPPIAPHIAALEAGQRIDRARLDAGHAALAADADCVVVEGAGGWHVPLNDAADGKAFSFSDWVAAHDWPVVLVVGLRLGCINHALLSAESVSRRCRLLGWIANRLPPEMPRVEENISILKRLMPVPCIGEFAAGASLDQAAQALHWPLIHG